MADARRKSSSSPGSASRSLRSTWRTRLDQVCPYPGESDWRGTSEWPGAWDRVSREFTTELPPDVQRARELEETVRSLRRWVEVAFVDDDPEAAGRARYILGRISREADLAYGLPRAPRKRRRYRLMQFLEQCIRAGLSQWPDFEKLSNTSVVESVPPNPDVGYVASKGPNGEGGWLRFVDLQALRELLAAIGGDLPDVPMQMRDELVAAWAAKRPGPKATASKQRRGAYEILAQVLRRGWNESTSKAQLKREWSLANPRRPRNRP